MGLWRSQMGWGVAALAHGFVLVACGPSPSATEGSAVSASLKCRADAPRPDSIESIQARYARAVHPRFVDQQTGCMACHGPGSGRAFIVTSDALETFHRARAGGLWGLGGATLLGKLTNPSAEARMPLGRPAWDAAALQAVVETTCAVAVFEEHGGGPRADEIFPPALLQPYAGARNTEFDVTVLSYPQLKGKVKTLFGDAWIREGRDLFATHIAAFGGVDFFEHRVERTQLSAEYLLAIDALSADVCSAALEGRSGPFKGLDVDSALITPANLSRVYEAMLFRPADDSEAEAAGKLVADLIAQSRSPADAWSGLCEALFKHPDFLFTLPPSARSAAGRQRDRLILVKVAQDLLARPPTAAELGQFDRQEKDLSALVDQFLASTEFRDYYFYKMRVRASSDGSPASDEPARLWTYLATSGRPFSQLLTGDYSVTEQFLPAQRPTEHGRTGLLTMKGFIANKPGLPHFNYAARALSDFMGVVFEVPAGVLNMREQNTAESTVDPTSVCFSCHQLLTPLAHQRLRWRDDGTYSELDSDGQVIDDTDRGLVDGYSYKGRGLEAFSTRAVKKESFIRSTLNAQMMFLTGRPLRAEQDERDLYKQLWDVSGATGQDLRAVIKALVLSPTYQQVHRP